MPSASYELVKGNLHRHGSLRHEHPHTGPHEHHHGSKHPCDHRQVHEHGHSHGLVDASIKRSREGVRAVTLALAILTVTAAVQTVAFALRSPRAEHLAGLAVVAAIFISACVAAYESILRLLHPSTPGHLLALVLAGGIGFAGNWLAALVRTRAGRRLESSPLIADGDHARADAYVSLAVITSAVAIAAGAPILDPIVGLAMTVVILRVTRESWRTVRGQPHRH
jgi:divalent metal cation (Fe/Co/Zn/Cd) transporter